MKVVQERQGVTNGGFATVLLLVLGTLWVTTSVFSAEINSGESETALLEQQSADMVSATTKESCTVTGC